MTTPQTATGATGSGPDYAMGLADRSYAWYQRAATKARRYYRITETLQLLVSAAIPVTAVLAPGEARVPALLGGVVVVLTGMRSVFHWQDDYLRFSQAREAVEAERRLYRTGSAPYDDESTRERALAAAVTRIEQGEMSAWSQLVSTRGREEPPPVTP
ncbi:DUF4231 domain-containing protein [Streptomyces galbus]|uniref:DUF4231 domain-containing protein n=1 Tax=Streptomyces galbus TaxID=33898 RepID=A0A4U5X7W0_STRGB|nr:DUF4231 domain-containing protein [Streptomyces galbus]TKT10271.1 DUF4231 domain-containing protein [Streptomyces galbus]GHD23419.1 hypothetical protein GCM10010335_05900 [Streptomyces galbus]